MASDVEKLRKHVSNAKVDWFVLDQARVNLEKDKVLLVEKEKGILGSLESMKKEKKNYRKR